jgi:hypothetical protein
MSFLQCFYQVVTNLTREKLNKEKSWKIDSVFVELSKLIDILKDFEKEKLFQRAYLRRF